MKKNISMAIFYLKKDKWVFISLAVLLYLVVAPLFIEEIRYSKIMNMDVKMNCFILMQKIVMVIGISFMSFMYQIYVEEDMREIINAIDHKSKWIYNLLNCVYFHLFLIPFYIVLWCMIGNITDIALCFIFQTFVLSQFYYLVAMISKSSLFSLGTLICYILIFIAIGTDFSIFITNQLIGSVQIVYYLKWIFISIIFIIIGYQFEKKYKQ